MEEGKALRRTLATKAAVIISVIMTVVVAALVFPEHTTVVLDAFELIHLSITKG